MPNPPSGTRSLDEGEHRQRPAGNVWIVCGTIRSIRLRIRSPRGGVAHPSARDKLRGQQEEADEDACRGPQDHRSEEQTSELQSLMRISYAVFCRKTKTKT